MAGIKETQELIKFAAELGNAAGLILQDDRFSWEEVIQLVPALIALPAAISGITEVPGELAELDETEKTALAQYLADEFDIPQEELEQAVEDHLKTALDIWMLINRYYLNREPEAAE